MVIDAKIGRSHVLILTHSGRVYGWGNNMHGQVGVLMSNEDALMKSTDDRSNMEQSVIVHKNILWEPVLVYPSLEMLKQQELPSIFDFGKQLEVYEDSSFLLSEDGYLFSWGKNENGFLGRQANLDIKQISMGDRKKKLTFSTFTPGKITKLEKLPIKKIKIVDGKFMAYLID